MKPSAHTQKVLINFLELPKNYPSSDTVPLKRTLVYRYTNNSYFVVPFLPSIHMYRQYNLQKNVTKI